MTFGQGHDIPLGSLTTIVWNTIHIQQSELWSGQELWLCSVTLDFRDTCMTFVMVMTRPWVMDNCVKYYPNPIWQKEVMALTLIFPLCALWPWPGRYDWHTLGSWTTIVSNIIQIQHYSELWPLKGQLLYENCELDLRDMTLIQGHDTSLGHELTTFVFKYYSNPIWQ